MNDSIDYVDRLCDRLTDTLSVDAQVRLEAAVGGAGQELEWRLRRGTAFLGAVVPELLRDTS